ncbi:MAG: glycosyltransferase family 2 protein [Acidimicrobiales bacterium]
MTGEAESTEELRRRLLKVEAEAENLRAQVEGSEWLAAKVADQQAQMGRSEAELARAEAELQSLQSSKVIRYSGRLRRALDRARQSLDGPAATTEIGVAPPGGGALLEPSASFLDDVRYPTWVECYDTVDDRARAAIRRRLDALVDPPLVSVILPVYNPPEAYLREALDSIRAQLYEKWQLCVADDASTAAWVPKVLAEYAAEDPRIVVERRSENGHISASSNTAISLATGEWLALFDHDDVMAEHALALAVLALSEHPGAGLLYSDEDHLDDDHHRAHAYFKPDFDPILLLGQNYFSHLCMLRRDLVAAVGGYRVGYEGSQDWDLVLRVAERLDPDQVVHVPHVLYHWRTHAGSTASSLSAKPYAARAAQRSVSDHLARTGQKASVLTIGGSGFNRVCWELPDPPPAVSVVVLARNGPRLVRCLDSIAVRSTYPGVELVVVDDGDRRPPLRQFLRDRADGLTLVRDDRDVSDSALRNAGARAAGGEVLCFVHDDVEVVTDRWLEEMVGLLLQPHVGAVGAKLLYPDGSVQHAGLVAGIGGTVGHIHRGIDRLEPGYFGRAVLAQSFSAVSWACMAVRREAFDQVGGFDEAHLSDAFGDTDFCLRLAEVGWTVSWTPHAELLHHEDKGEPREGDGENAVRFAREIRYLHGRWPEVLERDPAYNPNLSLAHETVPLSWPPRASYR